MKDKNRCGWCLKDEIYMDYHDEIWGVPEYDSQKLFEFINLEGAQAGLSWYTVLIKKDNYYKAFDGWDVKKIVRYTQNRREKLLANPGIIRNKLKVNAAIENAKSFIRLEESGVSFSDYLWNFVDGEPIINNWKNMSDIPSQTELSVTISKDLKKKGFKFVGPTIVYAFMQAVGMVDDHVLSCWRRS